MDEAVINELIEALRFYASGSAYDEGTSGRVPVMVDGGKIARAALSKVSPLIVGGE